MSSADPTERFTGLAAIYAQNRPTYPNAALDFIQVHCDWQPGAVLVDVGCGTGISSRLFAQRGWNVIGIEPNADMRRQAEAAELPPGVTPPQYRTGQAEATGLPDSCASAVLAAQAFHWFQPEPTLREFHRLLRPDGWVILMWNERDESDPLTAAYGRVIRSTREAIQLEGARSGAAAPLFSSSLFHDVQQHTVANSQQVDEAGFLGRALSVSYAPRNPDQIQTFTHELRRVFAEFQHAGQVTLHYQTSVTIGRKHD